ncbi:MAG: D-alanyl-D-alanine carboxypeptidase family protein [Bacilli bacterium]|nr:D-alanyl-D-alanine carboxypeptidase family protein [Bacilli bacterium]
MKKKKKISSKGKSKKNTKAKYKKRNKHSLLIFIILIVVLFTLAYAAFYYYQKHKYVFELFDGVNVELNTEVNSADYIKKIENATVTYNSVDTSTIGDKKIEYIVKDKLFKKEHKYYLTIKVTDDTAPVIEGKDSVTIYKNSKIDLNSYIKVSDNYDKDLNITHEGEVDTSKNGTYKVKYTVTDSSGNSSTKTITFTVKDKPIYEPVTLENGTVGTTSKGYKIENKNGATYINGIIIANKSYPLSSNYGNGLTKEVNNAFNEMKAAAASVGIDLYIGSGFRSYNTQKSIYNSYVKRDGKSKADTYSARPGYSEHQTGLAMDICSHNLEKSCVNSRFNNTEPANWLSQNAHLYGFILRYPSGKTGETGYIYESWHYRYVGKELATILYNGGNWITLENYLGITSKYAD